MSMISLLALIPDKTVASMAGLFMALGSFLIYEKIRPFHNSSTNSLAAAASLSLLVSYACGLFLHYGYGEENTGLGVFIVLIHVILPPAAYLMAKADAKKRAHDEERKLRLYDKLQHAQSEDRRKYDIAW